MKLKKNINIVVFDVIDTKSCKLRAVNFFGIKYEFM